MLAALALLLLLGQGCRRGAADPAAELQRFEFERTQMGVVFRILLYARDAETAQRAAESAFRRVSELNAIFSDYDPDSEAMRLCRSAKPGRKVPASRELRLVLHLAHSMWRSSERAFDVTAGPLVQLWREARKTGTLPSRTALDGARARVGMESIRIHLPAGEVELAREGMRLDFGGIAKGYALDEVLRTLKVHGIDRALAEAGGDLAIGEAPPGAEGWRVEIEQQPELAAPAPTLLLRLCGVATSGDRYQSVEIDGERYSHIVDPRTGLGVTNRTNVTVVALNGTSADATATAAAVLGVEAGSAFVERSSGASARFVTLVDGRPGVQTTKRWARLPRASKTPPPTSSKD